MGDVVTDTTGFLVALRNFEHAVRVSERQQENFAAQYRAELTLDKARQLVVYLWGEAITGFSLED